MSIPDHLNDLDPVEARQRLSDAELIKQRVFPLNQSEVSRYLGVTRMTICNWYTGRTPIPRMAWRALSKLNLFEHMKNDKLIKRRLKKLAAQGNDRAKSLYKDIKNGSDEDII